MRFSFLLPLFVLFAPALAAQEATVTLRGRVVNAAGEPVEYAQVGIPALKLGTISSADGRFALVVPAGADGTVSVQHVSYVPGEVPVSAFAEEVTVTLAAVELPPAVAYSGEIREKYLLKRGRPLPKYIRGFFSFRPDEHKSSSSELGSVATTKYPFQVREISIGIEYSNIPDCVLSVNVYRVTNHDKDFENILTEPIYINVPPIDSARVVTVRLHDGLFLDPGRYFFAIQVVDFGRSIPLEDQHMELPIYFQSSFERETPLSRPVRLPVNAGLAIWGKEYR